MKATASSLEDYKRERVSAAYVFVKDAHIDGLFNTLFTSDLVKLPFIAKASVCVGSVRNTAMPGVERSGWEYWFYATESI